MLPNNNISPELLNNDDQFGDIFFKRFKLRHAPAPLRLNDEVAKNYFFPTFYNNVTCAQAIFFCDYKSACNVLPHGSIKPVQVTWGRAVVAISCYEYNTVLGVAPYNEIAFTIPVLVAPKIDVPVLPLVSKAFREFGYYVFSMPVTSLENRIRGNDIWGLPKVVQQIDLEETGGQCVTTAYEEDGRPYFKISIPTDGKPTDFDETSNIYSVLDGKLLQSETNYKATFNVNANPDVMLLKGLKGRKPYEIYDTPAGSMLKALKMEDKPFQTRFARGMRAAFDLARPGYKAPFSL